MEIQSITSKLPDGAEIYVFGSSLWRKDPNDVNVLVVYDPKLCPPENAHSSIAQLIRSLADALGRPIHMTLLTRQEERGCAFKIDTGCVRLEEALAANPALQRTRNMPLSNR
jgi:predicted nucleotidyltransferase